MMNFSLSISSLNKGDLDLISGAIDRSISLITPLLLQHRPYAHQAMMRTMISGNGMQDLLPWLAELEGIDTFTVKYLAYDLSRKTYANFSKNKMYAIGIKKFVWRHSGWGDNPFREHIAMNGNIYYFDDPPIINSRTGQRGFPSDLPGCRCFMMPVIEFKKRKII